MKPLLLLFAFAPLVLGCHAALPPEQAVARLRDPSPDVRRSAADDLFRDEGVPAEAVPPLLEAFDAEQDPAARGAILITLGRSGAPEAKPRIDLALASAQSDDEVRWATRALKYWKLQTGETPGNYRRRYLFPYGEKVTAAPTPQ